MFCAGKIEQQYFYIFFYYFGSVAGGVNKKNGDLLKISELQMCTELLK